MVIEDNFDVSDELVFGGFGIGVECSRGSGFGIGGGNKIMFLNIVSLLMVVLMVGGVVGIPVIECKFLDEEGVTYTLTKDIIVDKDTCFTVAEDDITFLCSGYGITIPEDQTAFKVLDDSDDFKLSNCKINGKIGKGRGVYIEDFNPSVTLEVTENT
jgi:hypothetical protein